MGMMKDQYHDQIVDEIDDYCHAEEEHNDEMRRIYAAKERSDVEVTA